MVFPIQDRALRKILTKGVKIVIFWVFIMKERKNLLEKFRSPLIFDFYRVSEQKKENNKDWLPPKFILAG
jgi:hypothetical protein